MAKKSDSPLRSSFRVAIKPAGEEKRLLVGPRLYTFGVYATLSPIVHSVVGIGVSWIGSGVIYAVVHVVTWALERLEAALPLSPAANYIIGVKAAINYMGVGAAVITLAGYTLVGVLQVIGTILQETRELLANGRKGRPQG